MAEAEEIARELERLEPPRSVERMAQFLEELSLGPWLRPPTGSGVTGGIGSAGASAERFAAGIALRGAPSTIGSGPLIAALASRYSMEPRSVMEFVTWVRTWHHKRMELVLARVLAREQIVEETLLVEREERAREERRWEEGPRLVQRRRALADLGEEEGEETPAPPTGERALKPGARTAAEQPPATAAVPKPSAGAIPQRPDFGMVLSAINRAVWTANLGLGGMALGMLAGRSAEEAVPAGMSPLSTPSGGMWGAPYQGIHASMAFAMPPAQMPVATGLQTAFLAPTFSQRWPVGSAALSSRAPFLPRGTPSGPTGMLPTPTSQLWPPTAGPSAGYPSAPEMPVADVGPPPIPQVGVPGATVPAPTVPPVPSVAGPSAAPAPSVPAPAPAFAAPGVAPPDSVSLSAPAFTGTAAAPPASVSPPAPPMTGSDATARSLFAPPATTVAGAGAPAAAQGAPVPAQPLGAIALGPAAPAGLYVQRPSLDMAVARPDAATGGVPGPPFGTAAPVAPGYPLVPGRMAGLTSDMASVVAAPKVVAVGAGAAPGAPLHGEGAKGVASVPVTPLMGQVTLVAPPLHVASAQAEQAGSAVAFDWRKLAQGAGALDAAGLASLKSVLPPGTEVIYPAVPDGSLGRQAVNLRLAPPLLADLLEQGYGPEARGLAGKASTMALAEAGGTPPAMPLQASVVPTKPPMGKAGGVLGDKAEQASAAGALAEAGGGQAHRGQALDFLGLPVRLAPSLGGRTELRDEMAARGASAAAPGIGTIRPEAFAPLRNRLFPSFQSVVAEPDKPAWQRAAPHFGLRDSSPATVLAPDARASVPTATSPLPQLGVGMGSGPRPPGMPAGSALTPPTASGFGFPGSVPSFPSVAATGAGGFGRTSPITGFRAPSLGAAPSAGWLGPSAPPIATGVEAAHPMPFGRFAVPHEVPGAALNRFGGPAGLAGGPVIADVATIPAMRLVGSARAMPSPLGIGAVPIAGRSAIAPTFGPVAESPPSPGGEISLPVPGHEPLPVAGATPSEGRPPMRTMTRVASRAPERLYRAPTRQAGRPLAIQASRQGAGGAPVARADGKGAPQASAAGTAEQGAAKQDVQVMAQEVWSLLKRRLASEAERRGRW